MSSDATVFRVMIASPSDVATERQLIRDVVAEWTAVHSLDKSAVLLPVGWESHASPEIGERPQGIINKRLLQLCDLLIAVFWTRVGSPTGRAISGTIEEIEEHIAAGKETMIYFSQTPAHPDSIDQQQYESLKMFRTSCQSRGLYETYESLSEFREKLSRQLAVTMIRLTAGLRPNAASRSGILDLPAASRSDRPTIAISTAAQQLLKTASQDKGGHFLRVNVMGGMVLQANGRQMNVQGDARDAARWDAVIRELEDAGLVEAADLKREVFRVTNPGYDMADQVAP